MGGSMRDIFWVEERCPYPCGSLFSFSIKNELSPPLE
jgi:hypothetical protein